MVLVSKTCVKPLFLISAKTSLEKETTFERVISGERGKRKATIRYKMFSIAEVAQEIYNKLRVFDMDEGTSYAKKYSLAEIKKMLEASLKKIGEKKFWLRSNLSNIWSQFLDTVIFMFVAFLGIYPFATIIAIIIPWWLYKVLMGFLYTPLSYLGIYLLKGKNANQSN